MSIAFYFVLKNQQEWDEAENEKAFYSVEQKAIIKENGSSMAIYVAAPPMSKN